MGRIKVMVFFRIFTVNILLFLVPVCGALTLIIKKLLKIIEKQHFKNDIKYMILEIILV